MQTFRFDSQVGRIINQYDSAFHLVPLLRAQSEGDVGVECFFFRPGDHVGRHPAGLPQLFCVVAGEGRVEGEDGEPVSISTGQAAFWTPGEEHAAATGTTMTAIVVQAAALDPVTFLPEL